MGTIHALAILSEIVDIGADTGKLKAPDGVLLLLQSQGNLGVYWVHRWKRSYNKVSG